MASIGRKEWFRRAIKYFQAANSGKFHYFAFICYLFTRRSQLSICSEPPVPIKQLSCQSSIEPCVLEEDLTDFDDRSLQEPTDSASVIESTVVTIENDRQRQQLRNRPDSLILSTSNIESNTKTKDTKKFLYRSQSTKILKKPKVKPTKVFSNDLDQIYVISSDSCVRTDLNDFYDSIEVIHERRSKNFSKFAESGGENHEVNENRAVQEHVCETTVEIEPLRN